MREWDDLTQYWVANYGNTPPAELRHAFHERWVRFHSLPEAKRYADSEQETLIVLRRYNSILAALAEDQDTVLLLSTGHSQTPTPVRDDTFLGKFDPGASPWWSISPEDDGDPYTHVFVSEWTWKPGVFDPLLRLVADWTIANIQIMNVSSRWLVHPYDGGTDVILPTTTERNRLKQTFSSWLSQRKDGL